MAGFLTRTTRAGRQCLGIALLVGPTFRRYYLFVTGCLRKYLMSSQQHAGLLLTSSFFWRAQPHLVLFRRSDEAFFGRRRTRHEETHQNPISFVTLGLLFLHLSAVRFSGVAPLLRLCARRAPVVMPQTLWYFPTLLLMINCRDCAAPPA